MKKLILLLLISFSFSSQELTWHTDMNKASEIALKEKKTLLLFFTGSDWCGWCIRLQNEVLKKPEFAKWANKNAVLVELDFPRRKQLPAELAEQNQKLMNMFNVRGFPTLWFTVPKKGKDNKVELSGIGSQGYVAGGPEKWLEGANAILSTKTKS